MKLQFGCLRSQYANMVAFDVFFFICVPFTDISNVYILSHDYVNSLSHWLKHLV